MTEADPRIVDFLSRNRVLSIASARGTTPWAASVFYAFDKARMELVFLTEMKTRHGQEIRDNAQVAGTISDQNSNVMQLTGIQLEGQAFEPEDGTHARLVYLRRFPIAAAMPAPIWVLRPERIKFTNNRLGFGTKLHWSRDGSPPV